MGTATGGFVFRAERSSLDLKSATGLNVGPGTYTDVGGSTDAAISAPAPFNSTLERVLMENTTTSATTPGPGAYQMGQAIDALKRRKAESVAHSSVFASRTARLATDKAHDGKPGPGEYAKPPEWVKHRHRYTAPTPSQRVSYARMPSAPSIPYRHQCFGYEEGKAGTLVMQPPPDAIHTGVGRDTVGPGAYNLLAPEPSGAHTAPRAVQFGKSRTKRGLMISSTTPGPGQYDPVKPGPGKHNGIVVSIAGVDVQFGGASGTSQFASRVPLASQRAAQEWEVTPGPGAYQLAQAMGKDPLPQKMQTFGSTAPRGFEVDPLTSHSAPTYFRTPGPAAYDVPSAGVRVQQQAVTDAKPFNASGARFGKDDNGVPGPGEYRPDAVVNLVKDVRDKLAVSKGGVFGTTADRWSMDRRQHAQAGQLPGPGEYEQPPEPARPIPHKGNDGVFASKTRRFQAAHSSPCAPDLNDLEAPLRGEVRGDPQRLGPGSYHLPDQWSSAAKARHPLASNAPGFGSHSIRSHPSKHLGSAAASPGPGRYNTTKDLEAALRPMANPGKETVFGTQTARFQKTPSFTPGPGHYATGSGLTRKSYNITFNNVCVA